jgi:hypothetical protein
MKKGWSMNRLPEDRENDTGTKSAIRKENRMKKNHVPPFNELFGGGPDPIEYGGCR